MRLHTKNESVLKHHLEQNIFCERVRVCGAAGECRRRPPAPAPAPLAVKATRASHSNLISTYESPAII